MKPDQRVYSHEQPVYSSFKRATPENQVKVYADEQGIYEKHPITAREADCLSWAAMGKTACEIAGILKVSEHTVHFHLRNAIQKLEATNKTHAVAKAIAFCYIHPDLGKPAREIPRSE